MLAITVRFNEREAYDEATNEFVMINDGEFELELEHSLASLSKWESEFEVPFLSDREMTWEQMLGYIKAMTLTPNVPPEVYLHLSSGDVEMINGYLNRKMTATWFKETPGTQKKSRETYTAEVIYYMMFSLNIPTECENWHLAKLLTLIRVFNEKNRKPDKVDQKQAAVDRQRINEQRRAAAEAKRMQRKEGS